MSSVPCTSCGAEILPGTKFCRRCGQPSLDTASVSEAATRVFEATQERRAQPTENWNAQPTGPAYLSPSGVGAPSRPPAPDAATTGLATKGGHRKQVWIAVSIVALLILMFAAAAVGTMIKVVRTAATRQTPPVVVRPETGIPPPPPAPPAPPAEPPAAGTTVPTSELMYPGAETVVDMKSSRDNFLQLRTADPISKVVDWYTTRLKPSEVMKSGSTEAILRTGRTSVIITTRGRATDILIKQGVER